MRLADFCIVFIILLKTVPTYPQIYQVFEFEPVIVYSSKIGTRINEYPGIVTVIDKAELNTFKTNTINEILKFLTGIDLKTRGVQGIQTDPSLNGFSFEQILIMVNGIPLNDPQTGHHNLDLPIDIKNVERIEVISGGSSPTNGQNAFGGTINIILKNIDKNKLLFNATVGSHKYKILDFGLNKPLNNKVLNIQYNHTSSNGHRYNTDFNINRLNLSASCNIPGGQIEFLIGYQEKEFGANSFYSEKYLNQREDTRSFLALFNIKKHINGSLLKINIYTKYHYDHFLLDYLNPSFYENEHKKYTYGIASDYLFNYKNIITNISLRIDNDIINSNSLGNHNKSLYGFSTTSSFPIFKHFTINFSTYINYYEKWGPQVWPGVALSYSINNSNLFYINFNKSFRVPTFTELYYKSPANAGNSNLKPEKVNSIQAGYRYVSNKIIINLSSFYNNAYNTIDWIRYNKDEPWTAINTGKIKIYGIQYSQKAILNRYISFTSTYTHNFYKIYINKKYQSKYTLNNLRYKLTVGANLSFSKYNTTSVIINIFKRKEGEQRNLVDITFTKHLKSLRSDIFIKIENVFNKIYEDYPGVVLPGRWFKAGIDTRI